MLRLDRGGALLQLGEMGSEGVVKPVDALGLFVELPLQALHGGGKVHRRRLRGGDAEARTDGEGKTRRQETMKVEHEWCFRSQGFYFLINFDTGKPI